MSYYTNLSAELQQAENRISSLENQLISRQGTVDLWRNKASIRAEALGGVKKALLSSRDRNNRLQKRVNRLQEWVSNLTSEQDSLRDRKGLASLDQLRKSSDTIQDQAAKLIELRNRVAQLSEQKKNLEDNISAATEVLQRRSDNQAAIIEALQHRNANQWKTISTQKVQINSLEILHSSQKESIKNYQKTNEDNNSAAIGELQDRNDRQVTIIEGLQANYQEVQLELREKNKRIASLEDHHDILWRKLNQDTIERIEKALGYLGCITSYPRIRPSGDRTYLSLTEDTLQSILS